MEFFVGLHQPSDAKHFPTQGVCISVHRLEKRRGPFEVKRWILDSGAFTTIARYGGYPQTVDHYAYEISRWQNVGQLVFAVAQDYMCEPAMLARTGLTVADHQRLTIERYDALIQCDCRASILPVLQGYHPDDYVAHIEQYGSRLLYGSRVGVGSVCKRNAQPGDILRVLSAIRTCRPDLQLHGFGLKVTALRHPLIREVLASADSMAWSYAARKQGRSQNDWREAERFARAIGEVAATQQNGRLW